MGFNGQRVQTLIHEILERIIHKPMPADRRLADKSRSADAYPEMGAKTGAVGAGVAVMLMTFINHFKLRRLQRLLQSLSYILSGVGVCGHGVGVLASSAVR